MARQTRAQRDARREARGQDGAAPPRRPERPTANGDDGRPERPLEPRIPEVQHGKRRFSFIRFTRESWGELQKVEWPTQSQVIQGTVVVILASVIVGFYLWGADQVFKRLVQQVFLGQ